jgi:ribosomal protein S8E
MPPITLSPLRHMPLRYRIAAAVLALGCLLIKPVDARPADAQSGASRASEASFAASVEVPIAAVSALTAGSEFVVTGVVASGAVVAVTVSAVGVGASFVVYLSVEAVKALGLSAGHALEAVAVSGGWLLMASGEAICFIADEATRSHIHSREITSLEHAS